MNSNEIKIEDILADMRGQIAAQAQEIAVLRATITQYQRAMNPAPAAETKDSE